MKQIVLLLLLCTVIVCGCGPKKMPCLCIYCNETFWYVMQEEGYYFNSIYGFRMLLLPVRTERTAKEAGESSVEVGSARLSPPVQWRNIQRTQTEPGMVRAQIHSDIEIQLRRIEEEHFGDLFLTDSQQHVEQLRTTALITSEHPVCYLTLTMLVPKGNPGQFHSVKAVFDARQTLGIMDPSCDGLGESSWQVLGKLFPGDESAIPKECVRFFDRQYDLLEALEQRDIDAALVWNATSQANFLLMKYAEEYNTEFKKVLHEARRKKEYEKIRNILKAMYDEIIKTKSFADEIPLADNPDERCVIAVRLIALSSAVSYGQCERFIGFMRSNQGKEILRRFGFVPE